MQSIVVKAKQKKDNHRYHIIHQECDSYRTKNGGGTSKDVDWDAIGRAMRQLKPARRHWVTKMTTGHCASGEMMLR